MQSDGEHVRYSGKALARMVVLTMVLSGFAYLATRHANHALQLLPYMIILICPLMHFFHHRRHH